MFGNDVLKFAICVVWESTKKSRLEETLLLTKKKGVMQFDLSWIRYPVLDFVEPFIKPLGVLQLGIALRSLPSVLFPPVSQGCWGSLY